MNDKKSQTQNHSITFHSSVKSSQTCTQPQAVKAQPRNPSITIINYTSPLEHRLRKIPTIEQNYPTLSLSRWNHHQGLWRDSNHSIPGSSCMQMKRPLLGLSVNKIAARGTPFKRTLNRGNRINSFRGTLLLILAVHPRDRCGKSRPPDRWNPEHLLETRSTLVPVFFHQTFIVFLCFFQTILYTCRT